MPPLCGWLRFGITASFLPYCRRYAAGLRCGITASFLQYCRRYAAGLRCGITASFLPYCRRYAAMQPCNGDSMAGIINIEHTHPRSRVTAVLWLRTIYILNRHVDFKNVYSSSHA